MRRLALNWLAKDHRGASAVEFALLAPVFLLFLFGIIETGRYVWMRQVVQQAAHVAARCYALDASGCDNATAARGHAVTQAAQSGLAIDIASVGAQSGATCNGVPGQARVTISTPFATALPGMLAVFDSPIAATACFPA